MVVLVQGNEYVVRLLVVGDNKALSDLHIWSGKGCKNCFGSECEEGYNSQEEYDVWVFTHLNPAFTCDAHQSADNTASTFIASDETIKNLKDHIGVNLYDRESSFSKHQGLLQIEQIE